MSPLPTLPAALTARAIRDEDVDAITELIAACEVHDDGEAEIDAADVETDLSMPGFDRERDSLLVLEGDATVAWGHVFRGRTEIDVHPRHRGRGIGSAMLGWSESRARELGMPELRQVVTDANAGAAALLRANGYEPSYTSWVLEMSLEGSQAHAKPPQGVEIRAFRSGGDDMAAYRVIEDAFSEWEGRDPFSFEDWRAFVVERSSFSPQASRVAFDGDELVGAAMCFDYQSTDEGWIQQLATKASHRSRGIARALLQSVFAAFEEGGKKRCGLSTDSRTGALGLYERVGMHVRRSYTSYAKDLTG